MRKIKGFTLSEVLICLGIVGVISALTIPALVDNTGKKALGARVGRTVQLFQTGTATLLSKAQDNSDDGEAFSNLSAVKVNDVLPNNNSEDSLTDGFTLVDSVGGYLGTTGDDRYVINNIRDYNGGNVSEDLLSDTQAYRIAKLSSVIIFQSVPELSDEDADDNNKVVTRVLIDANGADAPNRLGKDVFIFGLANDGTLRPAGSQAYNDFDDSIEVDGCANAPNDGSACASRLVADNWSIKY